MLARTGVDPCFMLALYTARGRIAPGARSVRQEIRPVADTRATAAIADYLYRVRAAGTTLAVWPPERRPA
jgi:hypothetical protein